MTSNVLGHQQSLPNSVAIIMDGNRRWAERRNLKTEDGHAQGAKTAENIMRYAHELGIKYLTLFAFSSENWQRPPTEINAIMNLIKGYLKHDPEELIKRGIKVRVIGDIRRLPSPLLSRINHIMQKTAHCSQFFLTLAISYGSWEEIIHTCKELAGKVKKGEMSIDDIGEKTLNDNLFTQGLLHPDLFIRTSGELRLSNFLLYQLSYSELYFTPTLWPDFQPKDFDKALASFALRNRRFGAHQRN